MELLIKEIGKMVNQMDMVDIYMKMVLYMKVNGRTLKLMVMENFIYKMEYQKVCGKIMKKMDMVEKLGMKVKVMKDIIKMV